MSMISQPDGPPVNKSDIAPDSESTRKTLSQRIFAAFDRFASHVTKWAGSPVAFSLASAVVIIWAFSGPLFHYSETWQLVINTGTTIVTFLMVFLIQRSQNKDSQAVHLKLDELLHSIKEARDEMIDSEDLSAEDLERLGQQFKTHQGQTQEHPTP